jgi:N-glycosylase/DNA lyase
MESELLRSIKELKTGPIGAKVRKRMQEFERAGKANSERVFSELCFCILTANYTAEGGIRIQKDIGSKFCTMDEARLAKKLKMLGHRFPNARAKYIAEAQKYRVDLNEARNTCNSIDMREWLAENIKGLGFKESSHFLRNIGVTDLAIIDFHIIDVLVKNKLVKRPKSKTLTKKRYLEIERVLARLASKAKITLAELDLYLWYMETGKILK